MNFFRLRIINTLILVLIGFLLGYIIKENRSTGKSAERYVSRYPRAEAGPYEPTAANSGTPEEKTAEADAPAKTEPPSRTGSREEPEAFALPLKPETDYEILETESGEPANAPAAETKERTYEPRAHQESADAAEVFFRDPRHHSGQTLTADLQMILAKKTQAGWLLNFAHARGGKNVDYIYIEDDSLLGEKPDLKIGYFYKVRFMCAKGDLSSGNRLLDISPTGGKADWATGMSAIE